MARTHRNGPLTADLSMALNRLRDDPSYAESIERARLSREAWERKQADPVEQAKAARQARIEAYGKTLPEERCRLLRRDARIWELDGGIAELAWILDGKE